MLDLNKKYNLNITFISAIISSILIILIHNIGQNIYLKDFILPIMILIMNDLIITNKLKIETNKKAYILFVPIILILLNSFIFKVDRSNIFLNVIILPILISMFFLKLINKNYKISRNVFNWFFEIFPGTLFSNLKYIKTDNKNKEKSLNILKGLVLSIPIVYIIMSLLMSGDIYFGAFITKVIHKLKYIFDFDFIFSNLILLIIWIIIIFSTFINLLLNMKKKDTIKKPTKVNEVTIITILSVVNLVFVLFLISEISKLTVNFLHLPIMYTYAEYAREGFFQLLGVTIVNFIIIAYILYCTNISKTNKKIKYLLLLLIAFSIILIFNSYYRMFLYISAYGFTILRLQVILFLAMEIIIFICLIKKIIKDLDKDSLIFTTIIISTYILNLYLCNSTFINLLN